LVRKWVAGFGVVAVLAVGGGYGWEKLAERTDRERYPPPGKMIDIGGRCLHLLCAGDGGPTVLIEAGVAGDILTWRDLVNRLGQQQRTCAYDRAGLGWSDDAPSGRSLEAMVDDTEALLAKSGINGPLILVGHSFGGVLTRRLAARRPERIAGVVLVDAAAETYSFSTVGLEALKRNRVHGLKYGWAARLGALRVLAALWPERFAPIDRKPANLRDERLALYLRPPQHFQEADEMGALLNLPPQQRQPGGLGRLGRIPLVIITRPPAQPVNEEETIWQQSQQQLEQLSSASRHLMSRRGGHMIPRDDPDIIVEAVQSLSRRD
jgi:pimeloyl-ACP methyl ester carboxylesterase